jgi:hypothetical protein
MVWRLAAGGIVWAAALLLFVAGLQPRPDRAPEARLSAPSLVRALNRPQEASGARWWSWRVTRATSAHKVMLVDVEAQRVGEARAIAAQIIEPVRTHGYDEILIYVRKPGAPVASPARRIQWTPGGGFVEMLLVE